MFDFVTAGMLAIAVAALLAAVLGYNAKSARLEERYNHFQTTYETTYGIDLDINEEEYNSLTPEKKETYDAAAKAFGEALQKDAEAMQLYESLFYITLLMVSVSILFGVLIVHFIVPLFFHNGQTLGKKIFGLAVMRTNCVKATKPVLFIRAIFGLYTIETMFPVALFIMVRYGFLGSLGYVTIGLLLILEIGVMIASKHNASIHDLLTDTAVVDMGSQQIFETEEAMLAFKQRQHEEEVAKQEY